MESLVLISADLKLGLPNFFLWFLPKAKTTLLSALLLISVWEEFSDQPSVRRFLGERLKRRQTSS
jgi:hypothetical protein